MSAAEAIDRQCGVCSGRLLLAYPGAVEGPDMQAFAPSCHRPGHHGDLMRCRECGTVQQPSLPPEEELLEAYRRTSDDRYLTEERGRRRTARWLLDLLAFHSPGGRLLDVGCGHGLLLDEARSRGYEVDGIEPSRDAADYARGELGLEVVESGLAGAGARQTNYDAVVLADVLEHLDDPVAALDTVVELLAGDGTLLIATPDPSSAIARLAGSRWWAYLPAHTYLIPRLTLRELVAERGLVIAEDVPLRRSFSAGYWAQGLAERGGMPGALAARLVEGLPGDPLLTATLRDERVLLARKLEVRRPPALRVNDRGGDTKVHAVLPAYNAERTVTDVAHGLPVDALDRTLLVDDASSDQTADTALGAGLEVVSHPINRGYGANQKTCYARSILDGADVVVMIHADNQYDPSLVAEMVRPILAGKADVVIGSRLLEDEAVSGGMPRWKWIGNRALTWVENRAFRRRFSEYHTGYRAFSVPFLRSIPFLRNSDGFVFDQEVFAQIVASGARVVELAIPTRYFLEASTVSFWQSVDYGLRTLGVLARLRLDERRGRWLLLRRPAATLRRGREFPAAQLPAP